MTFAHGGVEGATRMLDAFTKLEDDDTAAIWASESADGAQPLVLVEIGEALFGFRPHEARGVADAAETAARAYPGHPDTLGLPELAGGLREAADMAEAKAGEAGRLAAAREMVLH